MIDATSGPSRADSSPAGAQDTATTGRPGGWSEADVRTLISMWSSSTNAEIAKVLGRGENAIAVKATRLKLPRKEVAAKMSTPSSKRNGAKLRDCLTCRTPFYSEGSHNRICDPCKVCNSGYQGDYLMHMGGNY